jgi:hypothetical protein
LKNLAHLSRQIRGNPESPIPAQETQLTFLQRGLDGADVFSVLQRKINVASNIRRHFHSALADDQDPFAAF